MPAHKTTRTELANKKGFTLIELIVVIAILAILSAIAIPSYFIYVERAKIASDQSAVECLNKITSLYRVSVLSPDVFMDDTKSGAELQGVLVDGGYLASVVRPKTEDAQFTWLFDKQKWYLKLKDSFYMITTEDGLTADKNWLSGSYTGASKDIVIPATLNGVIIKAIYQDAFKNKGLIAVSFDKDTQVQRIHARAFYGNNISSVDFPDTVERIDLWSFKDNKLTEVKLPPNLHTIEQNAFDGNNLTKITIGPKVSVIKERAFGKNTAEFIQAYEAGGAGSYIWNGTNWVKQS